MSLLDKATIITTPTAHSNGKLHSIKGGAVADFDVVRGSAATRVNAEGLIESVAINTPRIDYTTGEGVILTEPQSTNLIVNSELNNVENILVSAVSHTISFYGTGSITLSGTHSATLVGTGASDRVSLTFTPTAGTLICTDSGSVDKKQVEELSYSTSYIPTSGAITTRLGDVVTGAGDVNTFNSTEGVLYAEIASLTQDDTYRLMGLNDGSAQNRINITYNNETNELVFYCSVNNLSEFLFTKTLADTTTFHKCALSYKSNEFKVYIDGVQENVQLSGSVYPANTLDTLDFNLGNGAFPFYGKTKCIAVLKEALSDEELTCLTTI